MFGRHVLLFCLLLMFKMVFSISVYEHVIDLPEYKYKLEDECGWIGVKLGFMAPFFPKYNELLSKSKRCDDCVRGSKVQFLDYNCREELIRDPLVPFPIGKPLQVQSA